MIIFAVTISLTSMTLHVSKRHRIDGDFCERPLMRLGQDFGGRELLEVANYSPGIA
jgi:hypothetical protein